MREIVTLSFVFLFPFFFPCYAESASVPKEHYNNIKNYILLQEGKMSFILDFLEKLTCFEIQHMFFFSFCPLVTQFKGAPLGKLQGVYSDGISVLR